MKKESETEIKNRILKNEAEIAVNKNEIKKLQERLKRLVEEFFS